MAGYVSAYGFWEKGLGIGRCLPTYLVILLRILDERRTRDPTDMPAPTMSRPVSRVSFLTNKGLVIVFPPVQEECARFQMGPDRSPLCG